MTKATHERSGRRHRAKRVWLFAGIYLAGILGWSALYYHFRREFVVNPDVLRVDERQIRRLGQLLIDRIQETFRSHGTILFIDEPPEWRVDQRAGLAEIAIHYRAAPNPISATPQSLGSLIVSEDPKNPDLAIVRPVDARQGTETLTVGFQFRAFQRMVIRGYDSPEMTFVGALYFSLTTITTLGLGDILPKSDTARFLVVTEVLYGVTVFVFLANELVKATDS